MYVDMYVRTYVCMYVCTYVCMYVRTYVCMYVCTYYTGHAYTIRNKAPWYNPSWFFPILIKWFPIEDDYKFSEMIRQKPLMAILPKFDWTSIHFN